MGHIQQHFCFWCLSSRAKGRMFQSSNKLETITSQSDEQSANANGSHSALKKLTELNERRQHAAEQYFMMSHESPEYKHRLRDEVYRANKLYNILK